jgi:hypothetical protein
VVLYQSLEGSHGVVVAVEPPWLSGGAGFCG